MIEQKRLVVGVSGASAPHLAVRLLEVLAEIDSVETHLVLSGGARRSLALELERDVASVEALADVVHDNEDLAASISSGSFRTDGMVVVPCSMRSLAGIAAGISDGLLLRAADVTLKERRPLVLVVRETPLSLIHIRNMEAVTLAGAVVLPPVPAFYHQPKSIEDLLSHVAGKILDQFHIDHDAFRRWSTPTAVAADQMSHPRTAE